MEQVLDEAYPGNHFIRQFRERFLDQKILDPIHYKQITDQVQKILHHNFDISRSYAVKVYDLGKVVQIFTLDNGVRKDSTGNEIWAIIRGNVITTTFLRRTHQPINKLDVDEIIYDLDAFLRQSNGS